MELNTNRNFWESPSPRKSWLMSFLPEQSHRDGSDPEGSVLQPLLARGFAGIPGGR